MTAAPSSQAKLAAAAARCSHRAQRAARKAAGQSGTWPKRTPFRMGEFQDKPILTRFEARRFAIITHGGLHHRHFFWSGRDASLDVGVLQRRARARPAVVVTEPGLRAEQRARCGTSYRYARRASCTAIAHAVRPDQMAWTRLRVAGKSASRLRRERVC
jgi:hypothetical protein